MRNWIVAGAMIAGFGLLAGPTEARTIEEILQEKGVITAEEYQEALKSPGQAFYKPGTGITVASPDGDFQASLGGYMQLRYTFSDEDNGSDDSEFSIRRFKFVAQGHLFTPRLKYKFQEQFTSSATTEDVLISYKFADPFTLTVGQFKPPQARQELTSAARQLFAERSLANDTFNLGRDIGVQASGEFFTDQLLQYRLGVFNGNGPNTGNRGNDVMIAGRLDVNPLGPFKMDEPHFVQEEPALTFRDAARWNIGASFAWQKMAADDVGGGFNRDNDVLDVALGLDEIYSDLPSVERRALFDAEYDEIEWLLYTVNTIFQYAGLSVAGEYYHLNADPDTGSDWDADGYYVQAGYQLIPRTLEVAARYAAVNSDDANASARFDKSETQFGVNYYFRGHLAKLQADYTIVEDDLAADEDDQIFRLQAQLYY